MSSFKIDSIALIITTYNWPDALKKVLLSITQQTLIPNEIVIADDGSTYETQLLIAEFKAKLPQILHVWQEDCGFQAARSRNNAMSIIASEYVIMIDGDMVLEPHFVEDHINFARKGTYVQGRRAMMTAEATKLMLNQQQWSFYEKSLANTVKNKTKLIRNRLLAHLFSFSQRNAKNIRSCNMAFWRVDIEHVNGFDNDFIGWGREDSDLGWRLINSGIKKRHLRFNAVALHLHHPECARDSLPDNDCRLKRSMTDKQYINCQNGLLQVKQNKQFKIF